LQQITQGDCDTFQTYSQVFYERLWPRRYDAGLRVRIAVEWRNAIVVDRWLFGRRGLLARKAKR
jgi:hypothetical protein